MAKSSKKSATKPTKAQARRTAKPKETVTFLGKTWERGRSPYHGVSSFVRGGQVVEASPGFFSGFDAWICNTVSREPSMLLTCHGRTQAKALAQLETMVAFVRGFGK
jgi:hypothetical protein